jgi:cytosine/adenosine deaminase-related metal-dependent hydrolase
LNINSLKPTLFLARYVYPVVSPPVEDGALLVRDGRIAAVGKRTALTAACSRAAVVDFGDAVLLPPFVNAHTHLELTHFPRWAEEFGESAEPADFVDWILRVIRVKRSVDPERYRPSLEEGIRLAIKAGTGAVGDILSFFPARSAYVGAPLRGRLFLEALGRDPARGRELLRAIGRIIDEGGIGRMEPGISPHSPYTLSADFLEEIFDFARHREIAASIHFAESSEEVDFLRDSDGPIARILYPLVGWGDMVPLPYRRSPAAYLSEHGGLFPGNLLVHGVQVTDHDIERLARCGAVVVLCPRSNARLEVGKAPLRRYREAGVPLALGTDSLASCDSLSIWDELAFSRRQFAGEIEPGDLLKLATADGAAALGLEGEMGALNPGHGAHFQVLSSNGLSRLEDLSGFLCTLGSSAEIRSLYLGGRDVLQMI